VDCRRTIRGIDSVIVAEIYKQRWKIELFFKALKQSCKVKTFVGASANALKTQIWTALISMLLVKIPRMKSRFGWWREAGSNCRPTGYESVALTI
jgi:IS4 transposase